MSEIIQLDERRSPKSVKPKPKRQRQKPIAKFWSDLYTDLDVPKQDWRQPSGVVIAFAHSLVVPAGKYVSKPLRLRPFQQDFIRAVYNPRTPEGLRRVRQAVLSIARRGGKTLLAAVIILVHLAGPMKRANSTIVSAATTRKQAGIVFRMAAQMVQQNPKLHEKIKILDTTKRLVHRHDGSTYFAIAAEVGGSFGEGLDLCVYDELAQAKSAALYDALMTSLGSQVEPLMMVISTQSSSDSHILSELIDYGLNANDPSFLVHLYAAKPDADLLDEKEWYRANPALGDYRSLDEFRDTMKRASKVPSLEASVRNLYLNQRVEAKAPFLTPIIWNRGNDPTNEDLLYDGVRSVYGGLDLSRRTDLSAMVMAVEDDFGNVHLFPRAWTPGDTLVERGIKDRAPYKVWADQDLLIPVPGQVLDYDFLAADIGELSRKISFGRISYDRWNVEVLQQAFNRQGLLIQMMPFGQGFKDMAPAISIFEELAVAGKIRHGGHPVLRWCISNAIVEQDPAGNRKLNKAKSFGRIDVAVAAVMAVAALKLQTEATIDLSTIIF